MKIHRIFILNIFTKICLKNLNYFPITILNKRLKSIFCDFWFILSIVIPLFLFVMIFYFSLNYYKIIIEYKLLIYKLMFFLPSFLFYFLLLNKDNINAMSIGKRILGFKIVDYKTKKKATNFQCMLRNLTLLIWPIEIIISLINPKRRIGDYFANTEVINSNKKNIESLIIELNNKKEMSLKTIIVSVLYSLLLSLMFLLI